MFNLVMANHSGQAPWPMAEKSHTNIFNLFSRIEENLYPRCCSRIQGRMETEQFISQDVRALTGRNSSPFILGLDPKTLGNQ